MRAAFLFLTSAIAASCDDATEFMLPDNESPTVPANVVAMAVSGSEVEVVWDAATDNLAVTGYVVLRDGVELETVGVTQYTDLGVSPATTYSYTVMAEDAAGNQSSPSLAAVVTTPGSPDTESPTVPASVVATAVSGNEVEVVWDAATDNVAVTDYVVLRDGLELETVGVTQYTDLGVSPATTYSYTVIAEDAAGNRSSPSLAAVVTTPQSVVVFPGDQWEVRSPSELGMDGSKLDEFAASVGGRGIVVKDGYVVRTWGSVSRKEDWASAGKPVISTLLLFAIEEGLIPSVDGLVGNWGWDLSTKDESMTFYHLANMTSGYARPEPPGEAWAYNDYAIRLYGLTMQNVFDTSLDEAAQLRLAPIQLEDGSLFGSRGGLGVYTSVRDFARVGWLWLNKGNWNGSQLLPRSYFDAYMRPLVPPDLPRTSSASADDYLGIGTYGGGSNQLAEGPGIYGFNWWFNEEAGGSGNLTWPDAPADAFQAAGGEETHILTVIPSLKMVVAAIGYWGSFVPGDPDSGSNQNLKLLKEASAGVP